MTQKSLGIINWWGFSPAFDVQPAIPTDATGDASVNVLLVGAADARHILTTIARSYRRPKRKVNFYVIESSLESVARQILFLNLALEAPETLGLQEKAEMFLELFGNSFLRPKTRDYLSKFSRALIKMSTDLDYMKGKMPLVDLSQLKFKERDFLETILKFWRECDVKAFPINELWDERNRKYLETRYDFRKNAYDWDYNMKLMSKDAKVINSKQYIQWREKGIAFEGREGCYEFPNRTLASGMVVHIKGEKMARRGYFGDIVTSPYIVYGIDPEDKDLLKTTNNVHVQTAADISNITVTSLFHEILHKSKYVATASGREGEDEGPKITEIVEGSDSLTLTEHEASKEPPVAVVADVASVETEAPLIPMEDFKVIFLPLASLKDVTKKQKFQNLFHFGFFSNALVHLLEPDVKNVFAPKSEIAIESTKFILELKEEYHQQYATKIISMADKAGFKQKTTFDAEKDAVARFTLKDDD